MALKLWMGPSGSGKTRFLFDYIIKEAKAHRELNYIVIVPEQFTLSTQRELVNLSPDHGIINIDVLSFARLSYRIFEEVGFKDAVGVTIDDMGKNLIIRHIVSKCEDRLTVLNGRMDRLGYITEVKSAISEFMQYGISPDKITDIINLSENNGRKGLASKLSDMQILYREFNNYIYEKYLTKEEIISKAARAAYKSDKLRKSVVIFDGFTGFTPVQYNLIESLLTISRDIYVTILTDTRDKITYNTEHELFYLGFKTSEKLKKLAELNNVRIQNDFEIIEEIPRRFLLNNTDDKMSGVTSPMLVHLERNLFRDYSKPFKGSDNVTGDIELPTKAVNGGIAVFTGLQPIDEVTKVAVEISKIIRKGCNKSYKDTDNENTSSDNSVIRYKDIAIATGDLEGYMPIFKRVFREYNIPFFIDKTQPVLLNPFIEYIRALLDLINENFTYSTMFRYLRSPIAGYDTDVIDRLENFVLKFGVKGYGAWNKNWIEKYSRYYKKTTPNDLNNANDELSELENFRQIIMKDLEIITDLITDVDGKRQKNLTKPVNEINAVFIRTFEALDVRNRIQMLIEKYSITDDSFAITHGKEYEKIYDLVIELMNRMNELLVGEIISLDEYGELLDAGFDEIRIGLIPTITDYIQIGDVTRSRFNDIHTLFIVGANDGVVPGNSSSGGIISDIEKEFILSNTDDIELSPTVREQAFTSQLYLYMLMTKPTHMLFISYSRIDNNSNSIRPSYIVKMITDMFPGIDVDNDFESPSDKIYNISSLYDVISENLREEEVRGLIDLFIEYFDRGIKDNTAIYPDSYEDAREKLLKLVDSSFMSGVLKGNDKISRSVAAALYGKSIIGSVTRLEKFAKCSFRHFIQYGLSLKEREILSFESKDIGSLFHLVLEEYTSYIRNNGMSFKSIEKEKREEILDLVIDECVGKSGLISLNAGFRHKYMIERIRKITLRTINTLTDHLCAGDFDIEGTEVMFKPADSLDALTFKLSDDEIMRFSGSIDRLDTYRDREHVYIKIIDYKSGNTRLDLVEVYLGLSLQLVMYMNAAREITEKDVNNRGLSVVPAGILYYHIDDPVIESDSSLSDEEIEQKIKEELKMRGLVNSDSDVYRLMDKGFISKSDIIPISENKGGGLSANADAASTDDFDVISKFTDKKVKKLGIRILSGDIKAEPHSKSGVDSKECINCPYGDMCKFRDSDNKSADIKILDKKADIIGLMKEELKNE